VQFPADVDAAVDYPPGEELKFSFSDVPVHVYSNEITLVCHLATAPEKGSKLKLALSYQACDDRTCLPPVVKQMEIPV